MERVFAFFLSYRRNDGSYPLVLRNEERKIPCQVALHDPDTLGWYGYNNYFDYLAFAGLFLFKASECLSAEKNRSDQGFKRDRVYSDGRFFRVSTSLYDAVIAKTGGYFTNDLPFPYIVTAKGAIMPCYGGEQFAPSLYSQNDLPLPYFPLFRRTLRSRSKSWLKQNALYLLSPLGLMKRVYTFLDDEIQIRTRVLSPFSCHQQFLFHEDAEQIDSHTLSGVGYKVMSDKPLSYSRTAFCATGKLQVYKTENSQTTISIRIEP